MDSAIPVEVARFRTKEGLVCREVCGATRGRLRRAPAPLLYRSPVRSPEGTLSAGPEQRMLRRTVVALGTAEALRSRPSGREFRRAFNSFC